MNAHTIEAVARPSLIGVAQEGFVIEPLAELPTMAAVMDRFYKSDRLNRPGGTRERLIADREQRMDDATAWRILPDLILLISHHDSMSGRAIYARKKGSGLEVVQACRPGQ